MYGVASDAAGILRCTTLNATEILQSFAAKACKNSARLDVHWCSNSARFDVQCCRNSAPLDVQCCGNSAGLDVQCCRNSAHLDVQCCRNSAGNDVLSLRNFMCCKVQCCRNSESLLYHSQKKKRQIVEGPSIPIVSISFLFMLFLFFSDHSWNNNTVHADVFWMTG